MCMDGGIIEYEFSVDHDPSADAMAHIALKSASV